MNKKAISPVIAITLLIVVSIVAVIGYQSWYNGYQSILFSDTETKSNNKLGNINVEYITNDGTLYVSNKNTDNQSISTIKIGDVDCNINQNLEPGINNISIASCLSNTGTNDVIIVTDSGIIEEKIFLKEVIETCTLDSITIQNNQNYTFYNSSSVPFGNSCSSQVRVCQYGIYLGDSSYSYSSCNVLGQDTLPDVFSFTNVSGASLNTLSYSEILIPAGYDGTLSVNITGEGTPQISVNGGGWTTSSTINSGQTLRLRLTSKTTGLAKSTANLTLGNYSVLWEVETKQLLAYSLTVINDAPISYWKMDETSGTTATDQMGNYNGNYISSPNLNAAGAFPTSNTGTYFSGGNYIQMPTTNDFKFLGNTPFTIEFWTKMQQIEPTFWQRLISAEASSGSRNGIRISIPQGESRILFTREVGGISDFISCGDISSGWYYITVVYNGSYVSCYRNGNYVSGLIDTKSITSLVSPLRIGVSTYSTGWKYTGDVDEVAIYNYAFNTTQIKDHYNAGIYN